MRDALKVAFFQDEFHFCRQSVRASSTSSASTSSTPTSIPEDISELSGAIYTPQGHRPFQLPRLRGQRDGRGGRSASPCPDAGARHRRRLPRAGRLQPFMGSGSRREGPTSASASRSSRQRPALRADIDTSEEGRDLRRSTGTASSVGAGRCSASSRERHTWTSRTRSTERLHRRASPMAGQSRSKRSCAGPLGRWDHNYSYRTISPRHSRGRRPSASARCCLRGSTPAF